VAWTKPTPKAWAFSGANVAIGGLILAGVYGGLSVRWWVVDGAALLAAAALLVTSAALIVNASWRTLVASIGVGVLLGLGLISIGALVLGAAYARGVAGPVGARGVLMFVATIALLLPYLVGYPAFQLLWLRGERRPPRQT